MNASARVIASIAISVLIATLCTACGDVRLAFDDAGVDGAGPDAPGQQALSLIVTPGLLVVAEGEAATFTVALSEPPAATVTVTLASTDVTAISAAPIQLTFEPADGLTVQTVTVVGVGDADADDDHEMIVVRASGLADAAVAVTVTDDDALAVIATPSASLEVTEGSSAPLYLRLSAQPAAPVVVTAAIGDPSAAAVAPATVTFTSQTWNVDQAVVVSGLDDADVTHATTTIDLRAAGLADVIVPLRVVDDDVLGIQPSTTNLGTLPEGGGGSFDVRLTQRPPGTVTVALASSDGAALTIAPATLTFTVSTWNQPQIVTATAPADVDLGNESVTIALTAPGLLTRTVTVAVTDDDVQSIVVMPSSLIVTEGSTRTVEVRLAYQPAAPVTVAVTSAAAGVATVSPASLTFTPAGYAATQVITVAGVADADAAPGTTTIDLAATAIGVAVQVPVTINDDDVLAIETSTAALSLGEGGTATLGVRLTAMPAAAVVVNVRSVDPSAAVATPTALTFAPGTWSTLQTVTVSGVADLDLTNESTAIELAAPGLPLRSVIATIADDDSQVVELSATTMSVNEGGTGTVGVRLRFTPAASVTVTLTSNDPAAATVTPATLTFSPANHATLQLATVTGASDPDAVDDSAAITASSTGAASAAVTVTVNDDDTQAILVTPAVMALLEGEQATLRVKLAFAPAGPVTVDVRSGNVDVAKAVPGTLTFTAASYATEQLVTVTAGHDPDLVAGATTIKLLMAGVPDVVVTVDVTDDDSQAIVATPGQLSLIEGQNTSFDVSLAFIPAGAVVVTLRSDDSTIAKLGVTTLTFTPATSAVPQAVAVNAPHDADQAASATTIKATAPGAAQATVTVGVADDDL